ncbi:EboA domain-containing protein [Sanguibacter sp. 25GB23B1]|uniref:EboA domain-containing protein n=1 Tax=unclassified Sanguibacter TaxID=2645534 RepID=UPI0032AF815C
MTTPTPVTATAPGTAPSDGWLSDALHAVESDPTSIGSVFGSVGRHVGRGPVDKAGDPRGIHGTVDDAARAQLVQSLARSASPSETAERLTALYRAGDTAEKRGVLRGLDALTGDGTINPAPLPASVPNPLVAAGTALVTDALRTNDPSLVAAATGPFTAAHLDQHAWRHAVLKLVFMGVPLDAVAGLDERADDELARMAADFAAERRAAGRTVPDDLARITGAGSTSAGTDRAPEPGPAAPEKKDA